MRTDCQIDRKQVKLPNVTLIGFNRWKARYGYIVVWNDDGIRRLCRVVGRVAYAPACGDPQDKQMFTPEIRNWLVLVCLNTTGSNWFIRWAPPEQIEQCYDPKDCAEIQKKILRFLSDEFIKQPTDKIVQEVYQG
jgi:hypothetical protein